MRFINIGGELALQARLKDSWQDIYRVIPYPRYDGEYETTNWYTATHPETPYQSNIIAAKLHLCQCHLDWVFFLGDWNISAKVFPHVLKRQMARA